MEKVRVKEIYGKMVKREWMRLVKDPYHRLEFDTTMRFIRKYFPKRGTVLDAGGGPGRYTIEFAKMGYEVVLLDYTPELLEKARRQIARAGVRKKVKQVVEGTITDLSMFKDNSFDAVVCLGGPLSHVKGEKQQTTAVLELVRVAKKGAPVFISVMGMLAVLAASSRYWPDEIDMTKHFREMWHDGADNMWCGGLSFCHFFLPEELDKLVEDNGLKIMERIGLEGLASNTRREINAIARHRPTAWINWLECHEAMCTHPSVYATSGHMLIIGRKV